jgi:hypothetical protein
MPQAPKKLDVSAAITSGDLKVERIELKPPEDEQEKALRLKREHVLFYARDLAPWVFGYGVLAAIFVYCMGSLVWGDPTSRDRAWSAVAAILTGVIGYIFGRSAK